MIVKSFVMLLGEIDYMGIPFESEDSQVYFLRLFFFLMFLFSMAFALLNLLNAVAIQDTKEMIEEAETEIPLTLLDMATSLETLPQPLRDLFSISIFDKREKKCFFRVFEEIEERSESRMSKFQHVLAFGWRHGAFYENDDNETTFIITNKGCCKKTRPEFPKNS